MPHTSGCDRSLFMSEREVFMKNFLIVVDMQKDFVDGSLGTAEAQAIVENVVRKIVKHEGPILATLDTHFPNYLDSAEGRKLPVVHCVKNTAGWLLDSRVAQAISERKCISVEKNTFGSVDLPRLITDLAGEEDFRIELIGLCTDICVVSNALLLKAHFPEVDISVDANCCAGVTPDSHCAALQVMRSCQIDIR